MVVWMTLLGVVVAIGYILLSLEADAVAGSFPSTAAEYRSLRIPLIVGGIAGEAFLGFWIWRMGRVEGAKYELVKLVMSGEMTVEQAAKKMGVGPSVVRDAVRELRKEGIIE